ncbi:MAG: proton-conducting transporter membrane subunit [Desulfobulbaceae bacterium]|nr:proton-conducting transporter membrane subunit [Desulfobulbaceae bacterium]
MSWEQWVIVFIFLSSLVPGMVIFTLPESAHRLRTFLNLSGAILKLILVVTMVVNIYQGREFEIAFALLPDVEFVLRADALSALFATLSSTLWLVTTVFAVGYLEGSPNRSQFFGYFSLCITVTIGIALAGNLLTFLVFFELLTLTTYPLVVHRGTSQVMDAGRIYLIYALTGGAIFLVAVIWLRVLVGPLTFHEHGLLAPYEQSLRIPLTIIFILLISGVGVKAALVPFHGWLPQAMVAPAPVSALLHAVAVVKAGAFGIIRIVLDVYGIETAQRLHLLSPLGGIAVFTIVYGSVRALGQDNLKHRLAYSTVSQVSYITLGISMGGTGAIMGGLVHLVHQGLMKITLFFCAGNLAETLGVHNISEMRGAGRRLPLTMGAFTVGVAGMIGLPPMAGFVSKWYLGIGALEQQQDWIIVVLVCSTLLNAAYFLPIVYTVWFEKQQGLWPDERDFGRWETHWMLLLPTLTTALLVLLTGLLAGSSLSPLAWVKLIVRTEYGL